MKAAVLGSGAWGTALSHVLSRKVEDVVLYDRDEANQAINVEHRNPRHYSDVLLSSRITFTNDLSTALSGARVVVFAVPSHAYRQTARALVPFLSAPVHVLSLAKGFDPETNERLSEVLRKEIPEGRRFPIVSLLGPSYAEEVLHGKLTCLSAISQVEEEARLFQELLSSENFRVYTNTDEVGSEIAAALKNVLAIAAGILLGLGEGENARAALITRGNAEIMRFGIANGARMETFLGLSGIGDLMLTCNSMKSRNFSIGYEIGKADDAKIVLEKNKKTVEGVNTAKYVTNLARRMAIEMPIAEAVNDVLFHDARPSEKSLSLMVRELKSERVA